MKIKDINGNEIKAAFSFSYRGFEISASTIPENPEVLVFNSKHQTLYTTNSIPYAINFIDKYFKL